jgi:oxygen-independent coproporphyrinogen-3 oxidase
MVPNEQTIAEMYTEAVEQFGAAGIVQYEISNFARAGHRSRHNLKYWTRQPYLGFGLDAHSYLQTAAGEAIRIATSDDLPKYLDPSISKNDRETITPVSRSEALEEAWFLGLRLNDGVSIPEITREFGQPALDAYQPILIESQQQGLVECDQDRARLTRRGRLFANDVFQRFLGVLQDVEVEAIA